MIGLGVSETLLGIFQGLKETSGLEGKRYRDEDIDRLASYIVCRNYGSACLELSYLCWAIVNYEKYDAQPGSKLLQYFWVDENLHFSKVRRTFDSPWQCPQRQRSIELADKTLDIKLGQELFQISPTRVGILAALLDVMATIDPGALYRLEAALSMQDDNAQTDVSNIKSQASELQKLLYQYLAEHLPKAQEQNKFWLIQQWVKDRSSKETLSDDDILQFWLDNSLECEVEGFVKYTSVVDEMLLWLKASYAAAHHYAAQNALAIGADEGSDHISADKLHQSLFVQEDNEQSFGALLQTPKCLTQAQLNLLTDLDAFMAYRSRFLLTLLRYQVFGQWQSVLIQASRKSAQQVQEKLAAGAAINYQQACELPSELIDDLQPSVLSVFHVLFEQGSLHCLSLLHSVLDKSMVAQVLEQTSNWFESQLQSEASFSEAPNLNEVNGAAILNRAILRFPEFKQVVLSASKAFRSNNKSGFKDMPDMQLQDDYIHAAELLMAVVTLAGSAKSRFLTMEPPMSSHFSSDLSIFISRLTQLHGGGND